MLVNQISLIFLALISAVLCQSLHNSIYIIRNAEAPLGSGVLSAIGTSRASQCLPNLFGPDSQYDIGLVMTCSADSGSSACQTSFQTAEPVATSLGLAVDTTCGVTEENASKNCIKSVISNFATSSSKGILLVWDQNYLDDLQEAFGLRNFPENQPDTIFTLRNGIFVSQSSQDCGAIDTPNSEKIPNRTPSSTLSSQETDNPLTASPTPPSGSDLTPPQRNTNILNLYYTTTFVVPDPVPTVSAASGSAIILTESKKKRSLHSRRRLFRYTYLTKKLFGKYFAHSRS
ncbi:hypothetical protein BDZ97DRAFT_1000248 [Flammula alnicola]|nr:hypothetical protein BDZ97DRAFT_1000248 [Flammula alnicola]